MLVQGPSWASVLVDSNSYIEVSLLNDDTHLSSYFICSCCLYTRLYYYYYYYGFVGGSSADSASLDIDDGSGLRTSKSDTSLTDSFVVVPEARKRAINPLNVLRPGRTL